MDFFDADDSSLKSYLAEIAGSQPLSAAEEKELGKRIKQGDETARNLLIEANLRFVVGVAKNYQNRGLTLADLISSGNLGLITAAERFDWEKGFKFISYAVWWIKQSIQQTIAEHSRAVRLPLNRLRVLKDINDFTVQARAEKSHLPDPSPQAVAEELKLPQEEIIETILAGQPMASLDAPFRDGDKDNLLDTIPDLSQEMPDVLLARESLRVKVDDVLRRVLTDREQQVIRLYFPLDGEPPQTLEQIGARFRLTRERVRQMKEKALEKLRHPRYTWLWTALAELRK